MLNVLSLFNGMNCIGLALHDLGIKFELYASEIDKYANQVSDALFPNTVNLGDVTKIDIDSLPVFDLVVGGSPCQGFSFAGKQLNFEDERSKLFFDFVKILEACKKKNPNVKFILENVKMKAEYEAVISRFMGIDPIEINSALLSAQNRKRLYWTNIGTTKQNLFGIEEPGIKQPKDKGILLKDILELDVDEKFYLKLDKKLNVKNNQSKASCFTAGGNSGGNHSDMDLIAIKCARQVGRKMINGKRADNADIDTKQQIELREDYKSGCLTTVQKDNLVVQLNLSKESGGKQPYSQNRIYSIEHKSPCLDTGSRSKKVLDIRDKSKTVRSSGRLSNDRHAISDNLIRRLTVKECARLQTVPEWAIEIILNCGVSDSQLYKMLGNGWTIAVIVYILSHNYNPINHVQIKIKKEV